MLNPGEKVFLIWIFRNCLYTSIYIQVILIGRIAYVTIQHTRFFNTPRLSREYIGRIQLFSSNSTHTLHSSHAFPLNFLLDDGYYWKTFPSMRPKYSFNQDISAFIWACIIYFLSLSPNHISHHVFYSYFQKTIILTVCKYAK